ncbi:hypothetical protein AYX13_03491 [Cryptococcus neoformans]|nr:hypothetical protein AYX13_03491 [Cryptococcus neoformans var. grubii]
MAGDNDQSSSTQSTKTKSDESKPADTSIVTQSIAVESQAEKAVEGKTITTASSEIAPPNGKATSTPPIDAAINFGKIETKTEETAIEPTAASISNASKSEETVTKWEKGFQDWLQKSRSNISSTWSKSTEWARSTWTSTNRKISKSWTSMKGFRKKIISTVRTAASTTWKKGMDIYHWLSWDWAFAYSSPLYDPTDVVQIVDGKNMNKSPAPLASNAPRRETPTETHLEEPKEQVLEAKKAKEASRAVSEASVDDQKEVSLQM